MQVIKREEEKLKKLYGAIPLAKRKVNVRLASTFVCRPCEQRIADTPGAPYPRALLHPQQPRKFFDSGEWVMQKNNPKGAGNVGVIIPDPGKIPHSHPAANPSKPVEVKPSSLHSSTASE